MIVIISPTYGQVVIPYTEDQEESYESNVPVYSRDNTVTNQRDSVGSGAIIQPAVFNFNAVINNNSGDVFNTYNIEQIRTNLIGIWNASEVVELIFGESNSNFLFLGYPTTVKACVIKSMRMRANHETGNAYDLEISFTQQILVDTVFDPQIITVPANTSSSGSDRAKKALSPQNNGVSSPESDPSQDQQAQNIINDLKEDL
jgi:hypothetical protein